MAIGTVTALSIIVAALLLLFAIVKTARRHFKREESRLADPPYVLAPDRWIKLATVDEFLRDIAGDKLLRFTRHQLARYTNDYSARLGAGGFGTVYRGKLPNGLRVAVKVLHTGLDWRSEAQFVADMDAVRRARHANLVRLIGFCLDSPVRAMVCEYAERGPLDAFLVQLRHRRQRLPAAAMRSLAVGVARGIRHLHEECRHRIVHYRVKPGNVLLDGGLTPKVADFGLARLMNCEDAPPWMRPPGDVAEKRDVYCFGMLVLEILRGQGRSSDSDDDDDASRPLHNQLWFPRVVWTKYESGNLMDLFLLAPDDDDLLQRTEAETVERMCKVAFWCVQQLPEARPPMDVVVKMLEGETDVAPPVNPFGHLMAVPVPAWGGLQTTAAAGKGRAATADCHEDTWADPEVIPADPTALNKIRALSYDLVGKIIGNS